MSATAVAPQDQPVVILVADSVRARIFAARIDAALEEAVTLTNPQSRLHEGDLVEDSAGVRNNGSTRAKHSAFGGESAKRHRTEEFAAVVVKRVADVMRERKSQRLYIIAEPEFLGVLRQRMDRPLRRCVVAEMSKALATHTPPEIRAALPNRL